MNIDQFELTPSVALADRARTLKAAGRDIVALQTGEPHADTCPTIVSAAYKALRNGHTRYSFFNGLPELRDAIKENLIDEGMSAVRRRDVLVTHGAVQGIAAAIAALVEYEDEVVILEPAWPTVKAIVRLCGGIPVMVAVRDNCSVLEAVGAAITPRTRLIYLNSPNNPTGALIAPDVFSGILDLANKYGVFVLSDEVYRYFRFGGEDLASSRFDYERFIFADSFSKKFCMTGWRVGYLVATELVATRIAKATQVLITNVAPFVQYGALAALTCAESLSYAKVVRDDLERKSGLVASLLADAGLQSIDANGAFYRFIRLGAGLDDIVFSARLLDEYDVSVVPGSAYGDCGRGSIRISFAGVLREIEIGIERIGRLNDEMMLNADLSVAEGRTTRS